MRRGLSFSICLALALFLAGCRTGAGRRGERAPDWESPESIAAAEAQKGKTAMAPNQAGRNSGEAERHAPDIEKREQFLTWAQHLASAQRPVVVIDPGHGGSDPGAHSPSGRLEKEFTLDWAQRLAPILAAKGWQVFSTRTNDTDMPLAGRVEFAEAHRADLFVSLHFNSSAEGRQQGIETYCLTPYGMKSNMNRGYDDDPSAIFPNNAFDGLNLALACKVHAAVIHSSGGNDRGVRRARFPAVLKNQNRPAILIEGGYISCPEEAEKLADGGYRQKLAEAVADALK